MEEESNAYVELPPHQEQVGLQAEAVELVEWEVEQVVGMDQVAVEVERTGIHPVGETWVVVQGEVQEANRLVEQMNSLRC